MMRSKREKRMFFFSAVNYCNKIVAFKKKIFRQSLREKPKLVHHAVFSRTLFLSAANSALPTYRRQQRNSQKHRCLQSCGDFVVWSLSVRVVKEQHDECSRLYQIGEKTPRQANGCSGQASAVAARVSVAGYWLRAWHQSYIQRR